MNVISPSTLNALCHQFKPGKVGIERFKNTKPDILLVSDIEGCLIDYLVYRQKIDEDKLKANLEAINGLSHRLVIAYATGQDCQSVCYRGKYFEGTTIDSLVSDNGLEVAINTNSAPTLDWFNDIGNHTNSDWKKFVEEKQGIYREALFEIIERNCLELGYSETVLSEEKEGRVFPHHSLFQRGPISISFTIGQTGLDMVTKEPDKVKDHIDIFKKLVDKVIEQYQKRTGIELTPHYTNYSIGSYIFFTTNTDISITKSATPFVLGRLLPDDIVGSIRYVIGVGDNKNDFHLGLNDVDLGKGSVPVKSLVSGSSDAMQFLSSKNKKDLFYAPKADIGRTLVNIVNSND